MVDDAMSHRRARGQLIFDNALPLQADVEARLRRWLKDAKEQFADAKALHPKSVASESDAGKTYLLYSALSSDAAHPSVDALNRYVVSHKLDEAGGLDLEPTMSVEETTETLDTLCLAVLEVCIGVNDILDKTPGGAALNAVVAEYDALSNCAHIAL